MSIKWEPTAHLVRYKLGENDPETTIIVYARTMANIDHAFKDCAWYDVKWVPDEHARECRAKGMAERWV